MAMKERGPASERRPSSRAPKASPPVSAELKFLSDSSFMDLDDWIQEDDDLLDDFFPEEVKRR